MAPRTVLDCVVGAGPAGLAASGALSIGSVIWCTGFGGDVSYLDPTLLHADSQPRRRDAAGAAPGLWYLG